MRRKTLAFLHSQHPGKILKSARQTLSLEPVALLAALAEMGVYLSTKEYLQFELDENAAMAIGTNLWFSLCEVMELSTDVITDGYSEQIHLSRILMAIEKDTFALPVSPALASRLAAEKLQSKNLEKSAG